MKENLQIGHEQHQEFARLRRQVRAMQRQNLVPPQNMLEQLVVLDGWLSKNNPRWITNFPASKFPKKV